MSGPQRKPNDCQRTRVAEGALASIDTCRCGMMHLNIGALTIRLTPDAAAELLETLHGAVDVQAAHSKELEATSLALPLALAARKRGEA